MIWRTIFRSDSAPPLDTRTIQERRDQTSTLCPRRAAVEQAEGRCRDEKSTEWKTEGALPSDAEDDRERQEASEPHAHRSPSMTQHCNAVHRCTYEDAQEFE